MRELTLSVPKESLGIALNNMGACYSRMGRFPEAHEAIDRALELLTDEDAALASAYSTKGIIFNDSGEDQDAVVWLRKAIVEREKHPSPHLASMADDLTREIAVLKRSGRTEEARIAEESLASARARMAEIPESDPALGGAKGPVTVE